MDVSVEGTFVEAFMEASVEFTFVEVFMEASVEFTFVEAFMEAAVDVSSAEASVEENSVEVTSTKNFRGSDFHEKLPWKLPRRGSVKACMEASMLPLKVSRAFNKNADSAGRPACTSRAQQDTIAAEAKNNIMLEASDWRRLRRLVTFV